MAGKKHIQKAIVYAFICMYSFALLKPVFPVVNDIIAHTFYKMQHMATVHYENGAYHLHTELADELDQQKNRSKESTPSLMFETLAAHLYCETLVLKIYQTNTPTKFLPEMQHISDAHSQQTTPPPQA